MLQYAITDGARFGAEPAARRAGLLADAHRWALAGIGFVQLREKDLAAGATVALAREFVARFQQHGGRTRLLINHRADIAAAAGADGVHLTSNTGELRPAQVRQVFAAAGRAVPAISASCHSLADVERARDAGVDLILFGPVFEKRVGGEVVQPGCGLAALSTACYAAGPVPVLALGGIARNNIAASLAAGASGVAAIRLYQEPHT